MPGYSKSLRNEGLRVGQVGILVQRDLPFDCSQEPGPAKQGKAEHWAVAGNPEVAPYLLELTAKVTTVAQ